VDEHREVLEVAGPQFGAEVLDGGGDDQVDRVDAGVGA